MKKEENGLEHLFPPNDKVNTLDYPLKNNKTVLTLLHLQKYEKKLIAAILRT